MSQGGFEAGWLEVRFPFDSKGRNTTVEKAFLAHLSKKKSVTIVDVGAGTGANFLHLYKKLPKEQNWVFIDSDPRLIKATVERFQEEFGDKLKVDGNKLSFDKCTIELVEGDFIQIEDFVDIKKVDAVVGSALFDVCIIEDVQDLFAVLKEHKIPLLATLHYTGMEFDPVDSPDEDFIYKYERHMQRPQAFGCALGTRASETVEALAAEHKGKVKKGESIWEIEGPEKKMLRYKFSYLDRAIGDMIHVDEVRDTYRKWKKKKNIKLSKGEAKWTIRHMDHFITF